jgi:cytochrome P450
MTVAQRAEHFWDTFDRVPYAFYESVRARGDVVWDEEMHAWLVVSATAARTVLRDEARFAFPYGTMRNAAPAFRRLRANNPRSLKFLSGEQHARLHRWWVRDLLSPKWIARYREELIRPPIRRLLAGLDDRADLVEDFAERLPLLVFSGLLGLDDELVDRVKALNDTYGLGTEILQSMRLDAAEPRHVAIVEQAIAASEELNAMLVPLIAARRSGTGEDFVSRLWAGGPAVLEGWNEVDMLDACRLLLFAGIDTTTHAIANAYHRLLTEPPLADELRAGGEPRVSVFVEELLRLEGSVHYRPRTAAQDTTLHGAELREGDMVMVLLLAANRDPERHACPHAVQLDRPSPRDHLAFSYGPRACPGAALARAELVDAVQLGLEHLDGLRLDPEAPPPGYKGFLMRSHRPLNVRFAAG